MEITREVLLNNGWTEEIYFDQSRYYKTINNFEYILSQEGNEFLYNWSLCVNTHDNSKLVAFMIEVNTLEHIDLISKIYEYKRVF